MSSIGLGTVSGCARNNGGSGSMGGSASAAGFASTAALGETTVGGITNSVTGLTTGLESVGNASGTVILSGTMGGVGAVVADWGGGSTVLVASLFSAGSADDADGADGTDGLSGSICAGCTGCMVRGFTFALFALVLLIDGDTDALLVTRACNDALKPPSICDARLAPPPVESPNKTINNTCNSIDKITNLPTSTRSRGGSASGETAYRRNGCKIWNG